VAERACIVVAVVAAGATAATIQHAASASPTLATAGEDDLADEAEAHRITAEPLLRTEPAPDVPVDAAATVLAHLEADLRAPADDPSADAPEPAEVSVPEPYAVAEFATAAGVPSLDPAADDDADEVPVTTTHVPLETWEAVARCESGYGGEPDWSIDTGNGYYGGLQFSLRSWEWVGGTGYPHEASKATQIEMAERLWERQGWEAWPACSRQLGLR
jgi:hypothetical protein